MSWTALHFNNSALYIWLSKIVISFERIYILAFEWRYVVQQMAIVHTDPNSIICLHDSKVCAHAMINLLLCECVINSKSISVCTLIITLTLYVAIKCCGITTSGCLKTKGTAVLMLQMNTYLCRFYIYSYYIGFWFFCCVQVRQMTTTVLVITSCNLPTY